MFHYEMVLVSKTHAWLRASEEFKSRAIRHNKQKQSIIY